MKLRHAVISLALILGAGCDTMEQDADGQMLSINNDPAYFLPGGDGYIDLASRIISPGKIRVEITGSTRNGKLNDLGKGLLRYSPFPGSSSNDSFRFRVFSDENKVLGEDSIGIIIPSDTTNLPCNYVYSRNDTAWNVAGPVSVDVLVNDYACSASLTVTVNVAPEHGTASVVGNKIKYVPGPSFTGRDNFLYKAVTADPSIPAGYGMVRIFGTDTVSTPGPGPDTVAHPGCRPVAVDDLFFKLKTDTTAIIMAVLANDSVCDTLDVRVAVQPRHGNAWVDFDMRRIGYRHLRAETRDDTLRYQICGPGGCTTARVIIKRQ
ncbi:MAG TPA: Ig-like domain-containing protein [Cyclobacteriaceae bacterium]|nr:Ig-like domain-containing protein [Cyclobacteriaceae bacterium]